MNINEIVNKAKKDIDDGAFDVHLHGERLPVILVDRSAGNFYGFKYKKQPGHNRHHISRSCDSRPVSEDIPAELYGVPENKYNYYS